MHSLTCIIPVQGSLIGTAALEYLGFASLLHRQLDSAKVP
jgi:hypothetical protein